MSSNIVERLRVDYVCDEHTWKELEEFAIRNDAADEIVRLRRWAAEATTVIENWEAVFDLLIDPKSADLGVPKSVLVAKEIVRLRCDNGELRTRIEELEARRD